MRGRWLGMVVLVICSALGLAGPALAADVEIALFACLSGPAVDLGIMSRDGAVLAVEDVNQIDAPARIPCRLAGDEEILVAQRIRMEEFRP